MDTKLTFFNHVTLLILNTMWFAQRSKTLSTYRHKIVHCVYAYFPVLDPYSPLCHNGASIIDHAPLHQRHEILHLYSFVISIIIFQRDHLQKSALVLDYFIRKMSLNIILKWCGYGNVILLLKY